MKKLSFILCIMLVLACSTDDGVNEPENQFLDTTWRSFDPILATLYGPGSTRTIEFISETEVLEIVFRTGTFFNTVTETGTYTHDGDNVTWTIGTRTTTATRIGSILETTVVINGNPIIFQLLND